MRRPATMTVNRQLRRHRQTLGSRQDTRGHIMYSSAPAHTPPPTQVLFPVTMTPIYH